MPRCGPKYYKLLFRVQFGPGITQLEDVDNVLITIDLNDIGPPHTHHFCLLDNGHRRCATSSGQPITILVLHACNVRDLLHVHTGCDAKE